MADATGQLAGVSTGAQIPMPGPIRRTGRPLTGRCRALQTAGLTGAAGAGRRGNHTYRATPTRTPSPPPTTSSADSVFRNSFVKALLFRPSRRHLSPGELRVPSPTTHLSTVHPHTRPRHPRSPLPPPPPGESHSIMLCYVNTYCAKSRQRAPILGTPNRKKQSLATFHHYLPLAEVRS